MQFSFYIQYKLTLYRNNCEKEGNDVIYIFTRERE